MTRASQRLQRLHQLADLLAERDLARLRPRAQAVRDTATRLEALRAPLPAVTDAAYLQARQAHLQWAQMQRRYLQQTLAVQKAHQADAQAQAARSVARAQVLARLLQQGGSKKKT